MDPSDSESSSFETDDSDSKSDGNSNTDTDSDTEEEDFGFLKKKPVKAKQKGRTVYIYMYIVNNCCLQRHVITITLFENASQTFFNYTLKGIRQQINANLFCFNILEIWESFGINFILDF